MIGPTNPTLNLDRLARSVSVLDVGRALSISSAVPRTFESRGISEGPCYGRVNHRTSTLCYRSNLRAGTHSLSAD